jgi:hypothetical protein
LSGAYVSSDGGKERKKNTKDRKEKDEDNVAWEVFVCVCGWLNIVAVRF